MKIAQDCLTITYSLWMKVKNVNKLIEVENVLKEMIYSEGN